MPAEFGTLVERLVGGQVFFVPDGALRGTTASTGAVSATLQPFNVSVYPDYSLGRVNMLKYTPKTKDRTREYAASTGGYKERTTKIVVEDGFDFTVIDYAPQLFDQLMFGTAALAAVGSQQAFQQANRYKDGWFYCKRINESGVVIGIIEIHARLSIESFPEDKNEPGSPVIRIVHLADGGALDTVTFAVG